MDNDTQIFNRLARNVRILSSLIAKVKHQLFTDNSSSRILNQIKHSFHNSAALTFYTDGSLHNLGSSDAIMGIGWIQSDPVSSGCSFSAWVTQWPSSTRAETMAILTAIYTCPPECIVMINTDSQCCIDTYRHFMSPFTTSRRKEKIINWS